jgi:membrane protease YdiL (CAAX protease family)
VSSFSALLLSFLVALMLPLALVVPVYYRGRARARAGKLPGWSGAGWQLRHVWLAFSLLIIAELVVFFLVQPDAFARFIARTPDSGIGIELAPGAEAVARQLLWTTISVGACVLVVVFLAPPRLLWTSRWTVPQVIGAAVVAFIVLRLLTALIALPSLTSEEHPQHDLTETLTRLADAHSPWLTLLIAGLLAPLVEEVLFRGVLLTALARHISFGGANFIQATLFATLHLSVPLFLFFLVMGLIGGELMRRSGGLLAPILVHVFNNGVALAALWWLTERGST